MKRLFTFLLILLFRQGIGQTYVLIPDPNFAACLQTLIPTAMSGNSLNITSTLVTNTTKILTVSGKNISNLSGVEYFTSLTWLDCHSNNLSSLPALPNSLTYLACHSNSLSSLPVLPNLLQTLICGGNLLINLPTLPVSLQRLECYQNYLTSLPILPDSLKYIWCFRNSITSLPTLPNSLITLDCGYNSLTSIPPLPNSLLYFYCYNNYITSLPALPNSLRRLLCEYNKITCFPPFPNTIELPVKLVGGHLGYYIELSNNPFNCLPNYISAMSPGLLAMPICTIGNSNGCPNGIIGINENAMDKCDYSISPNPSSEIVSVIASCESGQTLSVVDISGKLLFSDKFYGKTTIYVKDFDNGIYFIKISKDNHVYNKKIAIAK